MERDRRLKGLVCGLAMASLLAAPRAFAVCGDGVVEDGTNGTEDLGEVCDDNNTTDCDNCDSNCLPSICGNGITCAPEQCDDGNLFGGDGCAVNCTDEVKRDFIIDSDLSRAGTQLPTAEIRFSLGGTIRVTAGDRSPDGLVPFVIQKRDLVVTRVALPGLVCVCTDSEIDREFGPGNSGFGALFCHDEGQPPPALAANFSNSVFVSRDHNAIDEDPECLRGVTEQPGDFHPGVCNGPVMYASEGEIMRGTAALITNIKLRLIIDGGSCSTDPSNPAKGPDGIPCTPDDPAGQPTDTAQVIRIAPAFALTGRIEGEIKDANNVLGVNIAEGETCGRTLEGVDKPCKTVAMGSLFDCEAVLATRDAPINTGTIALAFPVIDGQGTGDGVAQLELVPGGIAPPTDTPSETPTETPTETVTSTPTESPTNTPTRVASCPGDCSNDGTVTVNELITGVNIALGSAQLTACPSFDTNGDGSVAVNELIGAVRNALEGCPRSAEPTSTCVPAGVRPPGNCRDGADTRCCSQMCSFSGNQRCQ